MRQQIFFVSLILPKRHHLLVLQSIDSTKRQTTINCNKTGWILEKKPGRCLTTVIAVGDQMIFGVQEFYFAQIQSNLPKSNHFCPNLASILPKIILLGDAVASCTD